MADTYKSRVYTDRPAYADFDAPAKFQAIQSIIAKHLTQHPKAICSYSGGADSDILIDVIERTRAIFSLPPVKYAFFNTGIEMQATKDHVKATAEKYGVEIETFRPKVNIVTASRKYGIPFVSKIMSAGLSEWQKKGIPLSIAEEYEQAEDKAAKRKELKDRYQNCESVINFLCCCNSAGEPRPNIQLVINSSKYMRDFISECPPENLLDMEIAKTLVDSTGLPMKMISAPTVNERTVTGVAEYIEREALMRRIKEIHCAECDSYHGVKCRACWVDDTLDYIDCEPAADVAPVRRGRWLLVINWQRTSGWRCSECGRSVVITCDKELRQSKLEKEYPFCHCGAKMDGESDGKMDENQ